MVRRPQRGGSGRQRWRMRLQGRQHASILGDDVLRQRATLQGRQRMRLMLPDPLQGPPCVLRRAGDGDHHGHELLPRGPLPLRPQRHRLRSHGKRRPQRRATARRHHRHPVQEGSVPVPWADGDLPHRARVQPQLPGRAGGVRERRRRRGAGGPDGVPPRRRRAHRRVGAHAPVLGLHLEDGHTAAAAGALLAARHQRVRQDAGRRPGHPRGLAARQRLQLHRPVRLTIDIDSFPGRLHHHHIYMRIHIYIQAIRSAASCYSI